MEQNLLIVDDNERLFESLEINFRLLGFRCLWAGDGREALRIARAAPLAAAIIDLSLGDEDGIEVMRSLFTARPGLPAIMITGFGTFQAAVRATKLGAYDFLAKPLNFDKLNEILQEALRMNSDSGATLGIRDNAPALVGRSPAMRDLWEKAATLAATDLPVVVTGESGTGKELFAERIHRSSNRRDGPFVRVNCSAIADSLAESELFGHRKGAFTGASDNRAGLLREASGGTLHLDEIGDMSLPIQAKLLRVLEERRLRPLGQEKEVAVDVRVVASTNRSLQSLVDEGEFRADLFYRLNAAQLHIPPLRERVEDIVPLLEHFLAGASAGGPAKRFSDKAVRALERYIWPGNVRELRNMVKVCAAVVPGSIIELEDLPATVRAPSRPTGGSVRITDAERELIVRALEESGGNRIIASQSLGISRRTLYNKMKTYGIE